MHVVWPRIHEEWSNMGEVINLRRARKAKGRDKKETDAASNRAHHGTPKKVRILAKAEKQRAIRAIDAHKMNEDK